ncbi:hypothetical protein GX48_01698 [Paracoccidioides brasiliensis]|nr:hypothetical protein GX48_01698 [Paracoccidioides brasiliensis]
MVDQSDPAPVQPPEIMNSSPSDSSKPDSLSSRPAITNQEELHPNPNRSFLLVDVTPSQAASSSTNSDRFGISEGPVSTFVSQDSTGYTPEYSPDEYQDDLQSLSHSTVSIAYVPGTTEPQNPSVLPDQISSSGQTLLDLPHPPPVVENLAAGAILPSSSDGNAADQLNLISHHGSATFVMTATGTVVSPSLPNSTSGSGPNHPQTLPQNPGSMDDDEDMELGDGEQDDYDDEDYDDDDDDDDDAADDDEIPVLPDNLIEDSELSGFSYDRLHGLPPTFDGERSVCDESLSDTNDTEKFYITDDELSWCDPTEYNPPSFTIDSNFHGSWPQQSQVQNPTIGARPQPLSVTSLDNIIGQNVAFSNAADDDDNFDTGMSTQTESMESHFISPLSTLFLPFNIWTLGKAQHIIHRAFNNMNSPEYSSGLCTRDPLPNADSFILQTISYYIFKFSIFASPSRGFFILSGAHRALFVNETSITFLTGLDVTDEFMKSHEHTQDSPHFYFCRELPWPRTPASLSDISSVSPLSPGNVTARPPASRPIELLTEAQYDDIHKTSEESIYYVPPSLVLKYFNAHVASALLAIPIAPRKGLTYSIADGLEFPAFERNLTVDMFIKQWLVRSKIPPEQLPAKERPHIPISDAAADVSYWPRPQKISRPDDHQFQSYDIQKIPWWKKMNVRRSDARMLRDSWYKGYHNLMFNPHGYSKRLPHAEEYFKAKTMYTKYKASMSHFQLRNLMSVTSSNTVQYAHESKVYSVTPFHNQKSVLIDLSNHLKLAVFVDRVKISTMKAKHGVTLVGGFSGEYAMRGLVTDNTVVNGYVTKDPNGITNHIDIIKNRTSRSPQAIISSNDLYIRVLDCETNKFVQRQKFARAINCTDTSQDGRLRVIVGDAKEAWIVDSDTGKPLQQLAGHQDFGFACVWSPDMLHVATSNQDGIVNIWDARMWRILQFIESDVAGYRSLRYSPVGGGPRTLLMCEPADRISIVNAQTYQTRQVHDFFGEIGGADYTPDGGRIWVANMDQAFGGLMEFDRCQWGQEFGMARTRRRHIEERLDTYYPDLPNEWLPEADLDDDERCVLGSGERNMRFRRLMGNREHAEFLR